MRNDKHARIKALEGVLSDKRVTALVVFVDMNREALSALVPGGPTLERKAGEAAPEFIARARRVLLPEAAPDPKQLSDEELDKRLLSLMAKATSGAERKPNSRSTKTRESRNAKR